MVIILILLHKRSRIYNLHSIAGSLSVITTGSAPNQSSLGTMNGLAQAMGCISRSLSPSFASSLHSISLQYHLAGGNAVYYILMVIVAIGIRFTFMLPKRLRLPWTTCLFVYPVPIQRWINVIKLPGYDPWNSSMPIDDVEFDQHC